MAGKLKSHGINRVNISIDSLIPERFKEITREGDLERVIKGIDAAIDAGMRPIKLNMVVMKGVNDEEIVKIVGLFAELGVTKVRLTGGEPLLRKDILDLTKMLGDIPGLTDIPLSTTAHLL